MSEPPVDPSEAKQGERLDVRLERGAVEIEEVIAIARMLAAHLDEEHGAGRVDGAIVPARIELRDGGDPRLLEAEDRHRGVEAYSAPEAWSDAPVAASDQFSMAAILYEALCGGRAFPGDDTERIRASITTGSRVPLAARVPGLADAVDEVFSRALSLDPAARFPSCSAFAEALVAAIERSRDAEVLVRKPSTRPPSYRSLPPPDFALDEPPIPWLKVAAALALLAAVAALLAIASTTQ